MARELHANARLFVSDTSLRVNRESVNSSLRTGASTSESTHAVNEKYLSLRFVNHSMLLYSTIAIAHGSVQSPGFINQQF